MTGLLVLCDSSAAGLDVTTQYKGNAEIFRVWSLHQVLARNLKIRECSKRHRQASSWKSGKSRDVWGGLGSQEKRQRAQFLVSSALQKRYRDVVNDLHIKRNLGMASQHQSVIALFGFSSLWHQLP